LLLLGHLDRSDGLARIERTNKRNATARNEFLRDGAGDLRL
jgi:hypothetical protein